MELNDSPEIPDRGGDIRHPRLSFGGPERGKKTRQTEEEVGRQHQGMDRRGVRQVPEGIGEQGKMEKTGCKIICGAPTTLAIKGLMMMMHLAVATHFHGLYTG